jgi:hypothetical protein
MGLGGIFICVGAVVRNSSVAVQKGNQYKTVISFTSVFWSCSVTHDDVDG